LVKSKTLDAKGLQNKIGNITAMVQIGSVGGALIAFIACDKIGEHTGKQLFVEHFTNALWQDVSGRHANSASFG
jgi:hypothetical protein